jgi:regulator of sigma E protease
MSILVTALNFIVLIGILVFVHELGHYLAAIWTGTRADVFAIGMGPRLFGWNRRTGFTFGSLPPTLELEDDTDFRICAFPIGGYVKIVGMIDESMDTEHLSSAPQPYEFRSKNAWQKTLMLSAGVIMNIILAVGVFWTLDAVVGTEHHNVSTISYVEPNTLGAEVGFLAGDRILAVNGQSVTSWEGMMQQFTNAPSGDAHHVRVLRAGSETTIAIPWASLLREMQKGLGLYPQGMHVSLDAVFTLAPAGKAGLQTGDVVVRINGEPAISPIHFRNVVRSSVQSGVALEIRRNGELKTYTVMPNPSDSAIGVRPGIVFEAPVERVRMDAIAAVPSAFSQVWNTVASIGSAISQVFKGTVSVKQTFGGPLAMAQMAARSSELGLDAFFKFMALISVSLAVMNILPLPGLDGGHLVFVAIEAVIRREIPPNVKIRIQQIGLFLLLALMAFVLYLDITRL